MIHQASEHAAEYTHLGAHLRDLREHYELSAQQVAERLHIRPKYIEAIEAGEMSALPGKVYTQGYIQSYAEFLGLDAAAILRQYEGLEAMPTASQFRVAEPTRQAGMPPWQWIMAAAAALLLLYGLIDWLGSESENETLVQSRIQPVPERLLERTKAPLILTEQNKACLKPTSAFLVMPCYYGSETSKHISSIMELSP